jgi:hypothetical protein
MRKRRTGERERSNVVCRVVYRPSRSLLRSQGLGSPDVSDPPANEKSKEGSFRVIVVRVDTKKWSGRYHNRSFDGYWNYWLLATAYWLLDHLNKGEGQIGRPPKVYYGLRRC